MIRVFALATTALLAMLSSADEIDDIFAKPPPSAHTGVWWHWMGSQVTREGITRDLEYFHSVGISSATIFGLADVCTPWARAIPGSPNDGLLPFSDEWWGLVRFACEEAGKRKIELGMHNCPGYTSTGGPWIPPELAMRELVFDVTNVEEQISLKPSAMYPIFLEDRGEYGAPDIPCRRTDFREIGVVRGVRVAHIPMGAFTQPNPQGIFGLECDKMSPEAVTFHLDHVIGQMKRHLGSELGKTMRFILLDSYEAGKPTWTPRMREEFERRRGYDPLDFLPILGGYEKLYSAEEVARFRKDYDRTIAELYRDVLFRIMRDRLHVVGLEFACEPYSGPFDMRECAAYVDRLMAEFWFRPPSKTDDFSPVPAGWGTWTRTDGTRHNVIEAEAFTGQPGDCMWNETMAAIKACGDMHYLRGVNRFVLHTNPLQPWGDSVLPGVSMGRWGTHFGRNQTWAGMSKALFIYQARCQAMLQWGMPMTRGLDVPKPFRSIGRTDGAKRLFFVVNCSDEKCAWPHADGEWFDPVRGTVGAPPREFMPRQCGFLVLRGVRCTRAGENIEYRNVPVECPWNVSFAHKSVTWESLRDWTHSSDPEIRFFSGTAVYKTSFFMPDMQVKAATVELGNANGQAVRVFLNRKELGVAWCAPWNLSIPPDVLCPGRNSLEIHHANVWANRLIGDEQEPVDCEFEEAPMVGGRLLVKYPEWFGGGLGGRPSAGRKCFVTWNYFDKDSPLVPSGLLGPVRVTVESR